MEVKAQLNQLRIAPRKVRLVASLIKGMDVANAKYQLEYSAKKSSKNILTLLNSAIANAKNNYKFDEKNLYVSEVIVNNGTVLKRSMPRAMGRAFPIKKRMSGVTLILKVLESEAVQKDNSRTINEPVIESKESDAKSAELEERAKSTENEIKKISQEKENIDKNLDNSNNNPKEIEK